MKKQTKIILVLLFLPGYFLVWLLSFASKPGEIRKSKQRYKRIHIYGPFWAILIYTFMLFILLPQLFAPNNEEQNINNLPDTSIAQPSQESD